MNRDAAIDATHAVLRAALSDGVFPAASAEVGDGTEVLWRSQYVGPQYVASGFSRTPDDSGFSRSFNPETIFDLASLTKPIATTSLVLEHVAHGRLLLDDRVADRIPEWRSVDRNTVTVRDLLEHASGLPARLVDAPPEGRRAFEHEIATGPLAYAPRAKALYSDLGFILLGFIVEDVGAAPLDRQFATMLARHATNADAAIGRLRFGVPIDRRDLAAPTSPLPEDMRRGRMLAGEVHDNYAAALGGVAGHAGLFADVEAVGAFARLVLRAARGDPSAPAPFDARSVAAAVTKSTVPGSSRALGWDTMLPTSSCGSHMSSAAFGHVGFTGTSLWIDPVRDRYYVLLTNRVGGTGTSEQMQVVRRAFHDAAAVF